jgi:hypothetical protein
MHAQYNLCRLFSRTLSNVAGALVLCNAGSGYMEGKWRGAWGSGDGGRGRKWWWKGA